MNSIWNSNLELFKARFPALFDSFSQRFNLNGDNAPDSALEVTLARSGMPTAKWDKLFLHSRYDPQREAKSRIDTLQKDIEEKSSCLFLGFGLGYDVIECCMRFPEKTVIIVEKDPLLFFAALGALDWSVVFRHQKLICLIDADEKSIQAVLATRDASKTCLITTPAMKSHASEYFAFVESELNKTRQKDEINNNTLEKFSKLWLNNSCKNLPRIAEKEGVNIFFGDKAMTDIPFVVIAAGPSLNTILPHLKEISRRAITVCVDTALHALIKQGIQPDFILLTDPQYYCYLHLEYLSAKDSILITESAVWPAVFRFECKQIVLCSSMFPIGQFFENRMGEQKGKLASGGSVATTAWDFARRCGARRIYMAALDLGFPQGQTHVRGSQFEEREHRTSNRLNNAETITASMILDAPSAKAKDYSGSEIRSDTRMDLFAWWFERECKKSALEGQTTFSLTQGSRAIDGIIPASLDEFLEGPIIDEQKKAFFERAKSRERKINDEGRFAEVLSSFKAELEALLSLAKKGEALCRQALQDRTRIPSTNQKLAAIDQSIMNSAGKDAVSLVFPTERQLQTLTRNISCPGELTGLYTSKIIYQEISKAIKEYLEAL